LSGLFWLYGKRYFTNLFNVNYYLIAAKNKLISYGNLVEANIAKQGFYAIVEICMQLIM